MPYSPDAGIEYSLQRGGLACGEARASECIRSDTRPAQATKPQDKTTCPVLLLLQSPACHDCIALLGGHLFSLSEEHPYA